MNSWLPLFSDWTVALLPRLLLYPGGLWALIMLLWLRSLSGGAEGGKRWSLPSFRLLLSIGVVEPRSLFAAGAGWVGLALLPLRGAAVLPFPADRLSLAGLLLTSLALDWHSRAMGKGEQPAARVSASVAIVLAVMAPLAGGRSLLQGEAGW